MCLCQKCGPMNSPEVDICSWESNSELVDLDKTTKLDLGLVRNGPLPKQPSPKWPNYQYRPLSIINFHLNALKPFPEQALDFMYLHHKSFDNAVGKGEIAHNEQFLLFPQCFLPVLRAFCHLDQIKLSSAISFSLEESKICCLGKG